MKHQYTTQEKLWDLRRDHEYTLEYVADAVQISVATLSKYENKETKEYNNVTLNKLAVNQCVQDSGYISFNISRLFVVFSYASIGLSLA